MNKINNADYSDETDQRRIAFSGLWSFEPTEKHPARPVKKTAAWRASGLAAILAISPLTCAEDPWLRQRRRRTYTAYVAFAPVALRRISLQEARELALRVLREAEARRVLFAEHEARRQLFWGGGGVIYEYPAVNDPVRQGDIFFRVPRIDISLSELAVVDDNEQTNKAVWTELADQEEPVTILAALRPVIAIVASQDCDCAHGADITLCEIRPFVSVHPACKQTTSTKSWANVITQHSRSNLKWFYLPPDARVGFAQRMAVDFVTTIRIAHDELLAMRSRRPARLNSEADEHFRERLSEFFRRFPYDEWYPLSRDEFAEYRKTYTDAKPRPWQELPTETGGTR